MRKLARNKNDGITCALDPSGTRTLCGEWIESSDDSDGSDEPANAYELLTSTDRKLMNCQLCTNIVTLQALKTLGVK